MADIVGLLKEETFCRPGQCESCDLHHGAINEIERLRAEVETYKDLYASEIVGKAVRGE